MAGSFILLDLALSYFYLWKCAISQLYLTDLSLEKERNDRVGVNSPKNHSLLTFCSIIQNEEKNQLSFAWGEEMFHFVQHERMIVLHKVSDSLGKISTSSE